MDCDAIKLLAESTIRDVGLCVPYPTPEVRISLCKSANIILHKRNDHATNWLKLHGFAKGLATHGDGLVEDKQVFVAVREAFDYEPLWMTDYVLVYASYFVEP